MKLGTTEYATDGRAWAGGAASLRGAEGDIFVASASEVRDATPVWQAGAGPVALDCFGRCAASQCVASQ